MTFFSIVFKSFDFDQDILDLGDGLAVGVVATVVVLGEHLGCGLVGVYSGAVLGCQDLGIVQAWQDIHLTGHNTRGFWAELGQEYTIISLSFRFIGHKS